MITDTESAGATPAAAAATAAQSTPDKPAAEPAMGAEAALGDAGKRALDAMRAERRAAEDRAKRAEADLEQMRSASLSEHEKALAQARKEAVAEAERTWSARLRSAEVARALQAAGATPDALDLAVLDPSFAALTIDPDGRVDGLDAAVAAFRKARPSLFAVARPVAGNFDGGSGGASAPPTWTRDQIGAMSQAEFEKNEAEIMRAMREGRIKE